MFSDPIRSSEVGLIVAAAKCLQEQGIAVRCVWMAECEVCGITHQGVRVREPA